MSYNTIHMCHGFGVTSDYQQQVSLLPRFFSTRCGCKQNIIDTINRGEVHIVEPDLHRWFVQQSIRKN